MNLRLRRLLAAGSASACALAPLASCSNDTPAQAGPATSAAAPKPAAPAPRAPAGLLPPVSAYVNAVASKNLANRPGHQKLLVRFAPGGTGGFAANYAFTVQGPSIARAELTYAD